MQGNIPITAPPTDRVRIAPVPDWVVHAPYQSPAEVDEQLSAGGLCVLLNETQVNLTGPERCWHVRRAERVLSMAGAERAAQFSIVFDPTCEQVLIHHVTVRRGERVIEHAKPDRFDVMRRERSLERLILDGRLTVNLITPDVRAGDVVEASYTIIGNHPIFGDRYAAWVGFRWMDPVVETRHRLLTLRSRALHIKPFNDPPLAQVHESGEVLDMRWQAHNMLAEEGEPLSPPWRSDAPEIQFSEFASWSEVAAIFAPLYEDDAALPDDLQQETDALALAFPEPGERAAGLLRFVQASIRYLAISIGEGGLRPRPIAEIWDARYGDCKDMTRVYVTLARRMGLSADPALVNTREGQALPDWLPTAAAFDHCIVRLQLDGRTFWFDPTRAPQAGVLDALYQPDFGWALPFTKSADHLVRTGPHPPPLITQVEEYASLKAGPLRPALLTWRSTYRAWRADEVRDTLRNEGLASVGKTYLRQLQQFWPDTQSTAPLGVADDDARNTITVQESYGNHGAWRRVGDHRFEYAAQDFYVAPTLQPLPGGQRTAPIHLARPRSVSRTVRLELPSQWRGGPRDISVGDAHLAYRCSVRREGRNTLIVHQRLDIMAESMPAEAADAYRAVTDAIRESQIVITCSGPAQIAARASLSSWGVVACVIAGFALLVWMGATT